MGKKIALLIGVSDYKNEKKLPPCEEDILLMSDVISKSGKYDEWVVLNKSPNSAEGKEKISAFIRKYQNQAIDEVFFYYTGHGTRHSEDFLYLFSDFDSSKIEQTSLRNSEFDSMLKSLNPALIVKVVDACQAGTEYIKSNKDLQAIFEKSSTDSFNKAYFLFSSSSNESSVALKDYSIFTKSFAKSLLGFEGRDIRYRDIMAFISDDPTVKKYQTPLFIQQADNTEIFCNVVPDLVEVLKFRIKSDPDLKSDEKELVDESIESIIETYEDKLVRLIKEKGKGYCTEDEAMNILSKLNENIKSYQWSSLIKQLYKIEVEARSDYEMVNGIKNIANWLKASDEPYFAEVTFTEEEYETKEKVEVEDIGYAFLMGRQKRIEYKPVTRYRRVIDGIKVTTDSPSNSIIISLTPKELVLPYVKVFFVYIFSKSKLTIFFKHELERETSWTQRTLLNSNDWKTVHCSLKSEQEVAFTVDSAIKNIEKFIVKEFSATFDEL